MIRLDLNAKGTLRGLSSLENRLRGKRGLWDRLQERVLSVFINRLFQSEGDGRWAETGRDNPILRDTGNLLRSYTDTSHPQNINIQSPLSFQYGSGVEYAVYHEEGTEHLVPRQVIELLENDPDFQIALDKETQVWVDEITRGIL